jgi:hypothetical protein
MNEVNIKYWFRDFHKKKIIDFLDDLGLFIEEKPIFTKKRISVTLPSAVISWLLNENFVRPIFERCFQVRDFSFWITEGIGLTGVSFHFCSHASFWLLLHFQMKYCQFWCFWNWFEVKFYAELKKVYFMGFKVQSNAFGAQKRNLLVMKFFISRVTYSLIRNFMLSSWKESREPKKCKKITFSTF